VIETLKVNRVDSTPFKKSQVKTWWNRRI